MGTWLLRSAVLYGLWLALVDTIHSAELIGGAPAALIAGVLWTAAQRMEVQRLRPRPAMFLRAPRALLDLVVDTFVVTGVLLHALAGRHREGRFRAVRFTATAATPENIARWAATETLGSLAPNRYVVGIDVERGALLVHELAPSAKPLDPLRLG